MVASLLLLSTALLNWWSKSERNQPVPIAVPPATQLRTTGPLPTTLGARGDSGTLLKDIFRRSIKHTAFVTPTEEEVESFESLLGRSLNVSFDAPGLELQWNELGWDLHILPDGNIIVIEEQPNQRRGRGLYALRTDSCDAVMIQAPHRFYDTNTGAISRKLFEDNPIHAVAFNTVHRKEYDMAHQRGSFFNAFTRCLIKHDPETLNLQIHGFASAKRKGELAESPKTLAIISNATRSPDQATKAIASQMKSAFGKDRVWLFPLETLDLGATKNEQASVMRSQGNGNFLHLEMSRPFRERLMSSANERQTLYNVFTVAIRNSGGLAKTGGDTKAKLHSN